MITNFWSAVFDRFPSNEQHSVHLSERYGSAFLQSYTSRELDIGRSDVQLCVVQINQLFQLQKEMVTRESDNRRPGSVRDGQGRQPLKYCFSLRQVPDFTFC